MAKRKPDENQRSGQVRAAGDVVGSVGGLMFKRFGFIQSSVVSRWSEIVGARYAKVSSPESIRFPSGRKSGGVLTLLVEGAHAPLMQHSAPMIMERVNRFFGYEAVARIVFRQGRVAAPPRSPERPTPMPVSKELGEGLREIADPELRACLESLAVSLTSNAGPPAIEAGKEAAIPFIRNRTIS
jgi:hypothetical protein